MATTTAAALCRPPRSILVFQYDDIMRLQQWMLNTYYRHYKLYCYLLTKR